MRICDLKSGDWFERNNEHFMKVSPFLRGNVTYHTVSLVDGHPSFLVKTSSADHPSIGMDEVTLIDKPGWAREQE